MKVLKLSLSALMLFSLMTAICYGQTAQDYYDKGIDYGVAGKFEEAQQEFTKALELDSFYTPAKVGLELVEDALKQIIKSRTALHLLRGIFYHNKGIYDDAVAECKKAIEINPNYAGAHHSLGVAYGSKGMYYEAIAELKKAIEINPNYAGAYYNLGVLYGEKGMYDEEIAEYKKAIEVDPNHADTHYNLGVVYGNKGMYDEAIRELKKTIEINPNYADAYNNLAAAYYYKGEYSLAITYCDRAIELGYRVHSELLELLEPHRKR
ncbi:Photosystem I assembly protein Ycf3 [subsurface metagenome]